MSKQQGQLMHWSQIKCPFFHGDTYNSIVCEGALDDSSIRHTFGNKASRIYWEKHYCMDIDRCAECCIYKTANEKYE